MKTIKCEILVVLMLCAASAVAQTNTFPSSGNVGIGTISPTSPLSLVAPNNPEQLQIQSTSTGGHNWGIASFGTYSGFNTGGIGFGDYTAGSWRLYIDGSGNVGIDTTTPQYPLDVAGTIGANGIPVIQSGSIPLAADGTYQVAASGAINGVYTIDWTGPYRAEHYVIAVVAHQYAAAAVTILNSSTYSNPPVLSNFRVVGNASGDTRYFLVDVANRNGGAGSMYVTAIGSDTYLSLSSTPGGSTAISNSLVSLNSAQSGNVGIGTASPGARLEVDGNIKLTSGSGASITFADGTVQSTAYTGVSCGGDFAESVDVTGKRRQFEPGDVLAIDPRHPGKFVKSSTPYSTSVLGVYSTKPGFVGRRLTGPKSTDEVPMAMVGIVPTKVSTENGSIHPGDLLVSSSTPGYAMKGTDRSRMLGAVVGKALGSLDSGTGVIEAGITLQ